MHQQKNSNLIQKAKERKHWEWGTKIKTKDKLTISSCSIWFASSGWWQKALIPLVD
jgi:hypothetical protein